MSWDLKHVKMEYEDKELDEALDRWSEVDLDHPRLSSRVWTRIANEESEPATLPSSFRLLQTLLIRPVYASAFVLGCVLVGLLLAELRVARSDAEKSEQTAQSYKQFIDPLIKNTYLVK